MFKSTWTRLSSRAFAKQWELRTAKTLLEAIKPIKPWDKITDIGPTKLKLTIFKLRKYTQPTHHDIEYSNWLLKEARESKPSYLSKEAEQQREYEEQAFDEYLIKREGL